LLDKIISTEKISMGHKAISALLVLVLDLILNINADGDYMRREHSLVKPFLGAGMTVPFWDYQGSVMFTSNYVRLTPDEQSQAGSIWNQLPCFSRNWELQVSFKVAGKGKDLFGDGFVIWYAKERMVEGPVFGSKDFFSGLAIIADTYSNHNGPHNHQHPFLSAMINNGTLHYDHDRDGTHTQLAGCEVRFRNVDYDTQIKIRYENNVLTVETDLENKQTWKECFRVEDVELPTGYYFGASATTGDLSDNHIIHSIKFYELEVAESENLVDRSQIVPRALKFEAPRERTEDPKPQWSNTKIFFVILLGMIVSVILAIGGYMYYE
jgi:mannose-binding lectin 2